MARRSARHLRPNRGGRRRWLIRPLVLLVAAGGLVGTAAFVRTQATAPAAEHPRAAAPPVKVRSAGVEDWRRVLDGLDGQRAAAFAAGDLGGLARVYAPGSPAWVRDRATLTRLVDSGLRVAGIGLRTDSVQVLQRHPGHVELAVVDALLPYSLGRPDGSRETRRPGRGPQRWTVVLVEVSHGWRYYDVLRG